MFELDAIVASFIVLQGLTVIVLALSVRRLIRRYERFRVEVGFAMSVANEHLDDLNLRLSRAGYASATPMRQTVDLGVMRPGNSGW